MGGGAASCGSGETAGPLSHIELVVPVERIELPTFGLQNRCSTAELNRQTNSNRRRKTSRPPAAIGAERHRLPSNIRVVQPGLQAGTRPGRRTDHPVTVPHAGDVKGMASAFGKKIPACFADGASYLGLEW
jgi:hypothetical protein